MKCGGGKIKKMADGGLGANPAAIAKVAQVAKMAQAAKAAQAAQALKKRAAVAQALGGASPMGMKKGGLAAGHKSADGCAIRGKTRAMAPGMKKGGKC